ncbi:MAG: hypothetical protein J1F60_02080 [Oscillospiraceae bacterium]|nr:hypothetical protein [Oscillospiraceae bacterium]
MEEFFKSGAKELVFGIQGIVEQFKAVILLLLELNVSDAGALSTGVQSAAVSLTTLFLLMEMFSQMTSRWFERIEDAIQLWIKLVVAKIIIENSTSIIGGIYDFFRKLGVNSIESGFNQVSSSLTAIAIPDDGGPLGLGYILTTLLLYIVIIVVVIMMVMLSIEVMGIIFEIGIHQAVGAIALSTLCNGTFRSTGLSFIKSYTAVCLQTTVIGAIFQIYAKFADKLKFTAALFPSAGALAAVFGYVSPILGLAVLCVTVKKSSDITKRLFGA